MSRHEWARMEFSGIDGCEAVRILVIPTYKKTPLFSTQRAVFVPLRIDAFGTYASFTSASPSSFFPYVVLNT